MPSDVPSVVRFSSLVARRRRERLRDSEVRDDRRAAGDEDVVRLDVPVDDSLRVRNVERLRDVGEHARGFGDGKRSASDSGADGFAANEGHHIVRKSRRFAGREHRHDVRMLQPRRELHLAIEAIDVDARGELGCNTLITTARPSARSSATNTRDMPPPPSSD